MIKVFMSALIKRSDTSVKVLKFMEKLEDVDALADAGSCPLTGREAAFS